MDIGWASEPTAFGRLLFSTLQWGCHLIKVLPQDVVDAVALVPDDEGDEELHLEDRGHHRDDQHVRGRPRVQHLWQRKMSAGSEEGKHTWVEGEDWGGGRPHLTGQEQASCQPPRHHEAR